MIIGHELKIIVEIFRRGKKVCHLPFISSTWGHLAFLPVTLSTSWLINVGKVEPVTYFIFLDSKIIVDIDCSHEIKDGCSLEEKL